MQFEYVLPIFIVIIFNFIYHLTSKSIPKGINTFLSLTVTYLVATIITLMMYFILPKHNDISTEIHKINWTSYVLGAAIVGVEIGYIYMYRVGWNVSKGSLIASIGIAILLIFAGVIFYKENIGVYQIAGIGCCVAGLILVNLH